MRRSAEAELYRVADVEVAHANARGFDALGFRDNIPDRVGEPMDARGGRDRRLRGVRRGHARFYREITERMRATATEVATAQVKRSAMTWRRGGVRTAPLK